MKETKKKKLSVGKITISNYDSILNGDSNLDSNEQKAARGGTGNQNLNTEIIIFC
jgi:hypothetical protein